ncbi:response regulator transcription factor [Advenella mimigardefordensis]|uniref:Putative transcriptional regulator n=1 Tax=Advenella mimigardefordensis (strain DSM 17166 / LMG 22922 / DPN7) TaxID=1247726 RepID=W0PKW2_ADVMD|nr:response regulator transcription factor [Advenella mimigardefordensis]AHG65633.1 putative transcriptional regulator [Advenella mimigardefordensis DPN7]
MRTEKSKALRVLVIENDVALSKMLCEYLESRGYCVQLAHSGYQASRLMRRRSHHLALLDADMQDVVSLDWLKAYRRQSTNPLILLTGSQTDSVTGLKSGADDCLAKPLCMDELEVRMHALLRRHRTEEVAPSSLPSRPFLRSGSYRAAVYRSASYRGSTFDDAVMTDAIVAAGGEVLATGPLSLNPATGVTKLHGNAVVLTGAEQRILEVLMRSAGQVVQRENIGAFALGRIPSSYDRSIDTHISSLRKKLGAGTQRSRLLIRNLRGQGYLLATDEAAN